MTVNQNKGQKEMKTLYISGPITDLSTGLPREGWRQDFLDAEERLRRMGFGVVSPVDIATETEDEWRDWWGSPYNTAGILSPEAKVAAKMLKQGPTRATYIMACLQAMNTEAMAGRMHGVYILGSFPSDARLRIFRSDGVMMELRMARVLGLPLFARFCGDSQVNLALRPVRRGLRLLDGGVFGTDAGTEGAGVR